MPRAVPFFTFGTAQGVLLSAARPQAKAWRAMALRAPRATWAGGTCKDMDPHVLSYNSQTRSPLEKPPYERERREGNHHHTHRTHTRTQTSKKTTTRGERVRGEECALSILPRLAQPESRVRTRARWSGRSVRGAGPCGGPGLGGRCKVSPTVPYIAPQLFKFTLKRIRKNRRSLAKEGEEIMHTRDCPRWDGKCGPTRATARRVPWQLRAP